MEEAKQKKQEYKIPEIILSMTKGTIEYPSIIETDFDSAIEIWNSHILWRS